MVTRIFNKAIIVLSMALTLGLSACSGCSPHAWSSSESTISSISSEESESSQSSTPRQKTYNIRWVNWDGSLLYTSKNVPEGEMPVYGGEEPTREQTECYTYEFVGWSPEIGPAVRNQTYVATFDSTLRNYTITFVDTLGYCDYTQDKIENVPYNSVIHINHESITINDVTVTVELNAPADAYHYYTFVFTGWDNIYDGEVVRGDMEISAHYVKSLQTYHMNFYIEGGGNLEYYPDGGEIIYGDVTICNGKGYGGYVEGGPEGEPVTDRDFYFCADLDEEVHYHLRAVDVEDDFGTRTFAGWYMNGEILRYGQVIYEEMSVYATFELVLNDFSNIFEYEFDDIRREAAIIAVKSEYTNVNIESLVIPKMYNDYIVTMVKNGALCDVMGLRKLYIHNNFVHFEEIETRHPICSQLEKIVVEDGNRYMHMYNGVLYNHDKTELIKGTLEMWEYYSGYYFPIPGTVTYLWKYSLTQLSMETVAFPEGVTTIPYGCLYNNNLTAITFSTTITTIETQALGGNKFTSIAIPDSVTTLEGFALEYNPYLETINIGSCVEYIDEYTFIHLPNLKSITIAESNQNYASYKGLVYDKNLTTLIKMPDGIEVISESTYPTTLKTIGRWSIYESSLNVLRFNEGLETINPQGVVSCQHMTAVHLPASIKTLGSNCFLTLWNLTEVYYGGTKEQWGNVEKTYSWGNWNQGISQIVNVSCIDGSAPAV